MMPRPDFEKFCAQYKDKYYEILSPKTDDKCFINFAKVHDIRTRYQESYSKENNYGIFVDIFPSKMPVKPANALFSFEQANGFDCCPLEQPNFIMT